MTKLNLIEGMLQRHREYPSEELDRAVQQFLALSVDDRWELIFRELSSISFHLRVKLDDLGHPPPQPPASFNH